MPTSSTPTRIGPRNLSYETPPDLDTLLQGPAIAPRLFQRSALTKKYEIITEMHKAATRQAISNNKERSAYCLLAERRCLPGLAYDELERPSCEPVRGAVMIFVLPRFYERHLPELVIAEPQACNWTSEDHQTNTTYVYWSASFICDDKLRTVEIWVRDYVVNAAFKTDDAFSAPERFPGVLEQVCMLAGNTVAFGGYWLSTPV